ncbi:ATP-dependent DNA helicase [bacterium]|nr:MAG: ATP-dependent DNA helicase [bacterium]
MYLDEIFAAGGPLAGVLPGYVPRAGQLQMARLVERGLLEGIHTVVEAGTGVGKSLAYLVPALRSGKKVVISTGTIALQEQLLTKDVPLVQRALGTDLRVALLKGRNNYLCREKLARLQRDTFVASSGAMEQIWDWARWTTTGDRSELAVQPGPGEWEQVDADADDCLGELCPFYDTCFYFQARERARFADLVVVNHALFFLDLAMGGALLPPYDFAVLDEAHQCESWATSALTSTISQRTVGRMLRRLNRYYTLDTAVEDELGEGMRRLGSRLAAVDQDRYPLSANAPARELLLELAPAFERAELWLDASWQSAYRGAFDQQVAERRRELCMRGIVAHRQALQQLQSAGDETIAWVERGEPGERHRICAAPCEVASFLQRALFERCESVVLTSATLAADGSFDYLRRTLGYEQAQECVAPSPFDYERQAGLYLAPPSLNPKSHDFARRAAALVEEALDRTRGRAFVLFTSYARMREVHRLVAARVAFPCRIQGELARSQLLSWFRRTPSAVLFATGTFWEGVDVVGEQLSCVIIDRLPFPSPGDPLVAARLRAIDSAGGSSFEEYMIPAAITRLKQGFGRLIRSVEDRGIVVLLDGRIQSERYGEAILRALPPARRITDLGEISAFLGDSTG